MLAYLHQENTGLCLKFNISCKNKVVIAKKKSSHSNGRKLDGHFPSRFLIFHSFRRIARHYTDSIVKIVVKSIQGCAPWNIIKTHRQTDFLRRGRGKIMHTSLSLLLCLRFVLTAYPLLAPLQHRFIKRFCDYRVINLLNTLLKLG